MLNELARHLSTSFTVAVPVWLTASSLVQVAVNHNSINIIGIMRTSAQILTGILLLPSCDNLILVLSSFLDETKKDHQNLGELWKS